MRFIQRLAERKIREARQKGDFDDLPGKGEPLRLEDDSSVPETLRMAYKVLKNADVLPPELLLRKEIVTLEQLIAACEDDDARKRLRIELSLKRLQLETAVHDGMRVPGRYRGRVEKRLMC